MKRLPVPFNISLLDLTPNKLVGLKPVRSLAIFDTTGAAFHEDGLFSTSIFGRVGDERRMQRFSYIDIKLTVFHPIIFRALVALKRLYGDILSGREYAVWDNDIKDFERADAMTGQTGFQFFQSKWREINFRRTKSDMRDQYITLIKKYANQALVNKIIVIPAGLRDLEVDDTGRMKEDEINDIYRRILGVANAINDATVTKNAEILNTARWSLQSQFVNLYEFIEGMIEGKHKLMMGKWASRRIFNGTRNVITAMDTGVAYLGAEGNLSFNDTVIGLYQHMKAILPVAVYHILNGFLRQVFHTPGTPVELVNKKTLLREPVNLKPDHFDRWATAEGIEKVISGFSNDRLRHLPVSISNHYLGLIYKGPEKTFRLMRDLSELPEGYDPQYVTPITLVELLYTALYRHANNYPLFVTRYPIAGMGSIYPSMAYVKTTIRSEVRTELDARWQVLQNGHTAYEFPIVGGEFLNSLVPHSAKLEKLVADFDGDTCSANAVYTDEGVAEVKQYLRSKRAYIGTDGQLISSMNVSTVALVLHNLTGEPVAA